MAEGARALAERLFRRYAKALIAFFLRYVKSQEEASDLAQEVFVRMLKIPDTDLIRDPQAYLFTVARNLIREHGPLQARARLALDVDDPCIQEELAQVPAFGAEIDAARKKQKLYEAMRLLPPREHAAIVMQNWYGLSYAEMAQRLGVSTHMVKKYLRQAHVRLGQLRKDFTG